MLSNFLDGEAKAFAKERDPSMLNSDPTGSKRREERVVTWRKR